MAAKLIKMIVIGKSFAYFFLILALSCRGLGSQHDMCHSSSVCL